MIFQIFHLTYSNQYTVHNNAILESIKFPAGDEFYAAVKVSNFMG